MYGSQIPPTYSPWPYGTPASPGVPSTVYVDRFNDQQVAGRKDWIVAAQAGVAETIAQFSVSDNATGNFSISNNLTVDGAFATLLRGVGGVSVSPLLTLLAQNNTDTGTMPMMAFNSRVNTNIPITTRPIAAFQNNGSDVLSLLPLNSGANSALSWGTQTGTLPTFTTRSIGTRIVYYNQLTASHVDYASGFFDGSPSGVWHSVPRATSVYEHRFYGGTTNIATIRGDGLLITTGGQVVKGRTALTSPVTVLVTDFYIRYKPTVDAAGSLVLPDPSTVAANTVFRVKNRSTAFNLTVTSAVGTIDGAASRVLAPGGAADFIGDGVSDYDVN